MDMGYVQRMMLVAFVAMWVVVLSGCSSLAAVEATTSPEATNQGAMRNQVTPVASTLDTETESDVVSAFQGTLEDIYETVGPSVVHIQVTQRAESAQGLPVLPDFPFQHPGEPSDLPPMQGAGSGFVWDDQGHIVTNNHVIAGADTIRVAFADGQSFDATVVGRDPDSDLAVLRIDAPASMLQPVRLADSSNTKVGQLAIAIGNPFGLAGTMTVGIVSAVGRSLPVEAGTAGQRYTIPEIIQTDAPINPGNSGGVLLNSSGEVIGVTTAIESPVRASVGIGFAVPSAIVEKVVPALIADGKYDHAWLGISGTTLTPELAEAMGLDRNQRGALVAEVMLDGPAKAAGLMGSAETTTIEGQEVRIGGDVIIAIDETPVNDFDDLVTALAHMQAGQRITLTVLRQGKEQQIEVVLATRPTSTNQE